jgi:hypothetical protein
MCKIDIFNETFVDVVYYGPNGEIHAIAVSSDTVADDLCRLLEKDDDVLTVVTMPGRVYDSAIQAYLKIRENRK